MCPWRSTTTLRRGRVTCSQQVRAAAAIVGFCECPQVQSFALSHVVGSGPVATVFALWEAPNSLPCLVTRSHLRYASVSCCWLSTSPLCELTPGCLVTVSGKLINGEDNLFLPGVVRERNLGRSPRPL